MELGKTLKTFGVMPTFIGSVDIYSDWHQDKNHELKWGKHFCGTFGVVDIPEFEDIYLFQHNEPVGRTWQKHHTLFAEFILENLGEDINCLEIGAGSGVLLREIESAAKSQIRWDIVDPNPLTITNQRGKIFRGFFPEAISREKVNQDLGNQNLIHSHLIEHVPNVPNFLRSCNDFLPLGGKMIFSFPNFDVMAKNLDLNMLMFEHITFLPFREMEALILNAGFEISEVKYFEKHSIFVTVTKRKLANINDFVSTVNEEEFSELALNFERS